MENKAGLLNPNTFVNTLISNHLVRGRYWECWAEDQTGQKRKLREREKKGQNSIAIQSRASASYGEKGLTLVQIRFKSLGEFPDGDNTQMSSLCHQM